MGLNAAGDQQDARWSGPGGDFSPTAAQIIEREGAIVEISYEHADYFTRNLCAIRCEERATLAVYQPFAFVKGTFPAGMAASNAQPQHVAKKS